MNHSLVTEIIKKFLDGTCSDEEFAYLLYWYESFDEYPELHLSEEEIELCRQGMLKRIRLNNPELSEHPAKGFTGKVKRRGIFTWLGYAAAAMVLGMIAYIGLHHSGRLTSGGATRHVVTSDLIRTENTSGHIHRIMLPDSSVVWLSPRSRIEYSGSGFAEARLIRLSGEAFFTIYRDPQHPFVVKSEGLVTRVLGTSFLLKAYLNAPVEVTVMNGKIEVFQENKEEERMTLVEDDKVVLNTNGELVKLKANGNKAKSRWDKINLSFNNTPFTEVMKELDRKFNVHLYCKDSVIAHYRLNADFTNQNLADILELLGKSLNINYEMESDSVISVSLSGG